MGTNFYAVLPVKSRTSNRLRKLADKLDEGKIVDWVDELYEIRMELKKTEIHLGKRSYGWAFLWDHNHLRYYKPTLESIEKFIKDNNARIMDEYGRMFTWEQFINDEIEKSLYPTKAIRTKEELEELFNTIERTDEFYKYILDNFISKGLPYYLYCTAKTYHEMHPNEPNTGYKHYDQKIIEYAKDGIIDDNYSDFITKDNLRFALFTDFS